jgi:hypothetical protein
LQLFPNPADDWLILQPSRKPVNGTVFIFDLRGIELSRADISTDKALIDIGHLPSGLYFVRFISDNVVETGRFIKQ